MAYQKYGTKLFRDGIQVRHLDGNRTNFLEDNIKIGTASDNYYDIPEEIRRKRSEKGIKAASKVTRRWTDQEIAIIRARYDETRSYKVVMQEFNITSKGSLYYILHHKYLTGKESIAEVL